MKLAISQSQGKLPRFPSTNDNLFNLLDGHTTQLLKSRDNSSLSLMSNTVEEERKLRNVKSHMFKDYVTPNGSHDWHPLLGKLPIFKRPKAQISSKAVKNNIKELYFAFQPDKLKENLDISIRRATEEEKNKQEETSLVRLPNIIQNKQVSYPPVPRLSLFKDISSIQTRSPMKSNDTSVMKKQESQKSSPNISQINIGGNTYGVNQNLYKL